MSKRGLGKGLDALLSTSNLSKEKQKPSTAVSAVISGEETLLEINISQLKPGTYQPRKAIQPDALEELSASIRSQGIIQPIVVRLVSEGMYEIIAGERRWQAARKAGLQKVPCLVKRVEDRAAIAMALIENIQREDLNVIEEAQALERLQSEFTLTHQQVAEVVGKSRTTISNLLRLNQLAAKVKAMVEQKKLEMGHARALLAIDVKDQFELAKIIEQKKLTVRQTENIVKKQLAGEPSTDISRPKKMEYMVDESKQLSHKLGSQVKITRSHDGKATLTIQMDNTEKLKELMSLLDS